MKITKKQLKQIIKEEIESTLKEGFPRPDRDYVQNPPMRNRPYSAPEQEDRDKRSQLRIDAVDFLRSSKAAGELWDKLRDHTYGSEEEYNTDLNAFAALFDKNLQDMARKLVRMNQH